jgi:hypothetical protein
VSDSQSTIKAFSNHQITSKLVLDCHQSFMQHAKQLTWVPDQEGIDGNETAA